MDFDEIKIALEKNIKTLDVPFLINSIESLILSNRIEMVKRIVYSQQFRPKSLDDQYTVLKFIGLQDALPLDVRVNAVIASAHKALESMNECFVAEALQQVQLSQTLLSNLRFGQDYVRVDRLHISYSFFSVYIHLALFVKDFVLFSKICEEAYGFYKQLPRSLEKPLLFQTSGNISRCFSFYLVSLFLQEKTVNLQVLEDVVFDIKKVMSEGLVLADCNPIKHKEFRRELELFEHACNLKTSLNSSNGGGDFSCAIVNLFETALRPEGKSKVAYLSALFVQELLPKALKSYKHCAMEDFNGVKPIKRLVVYEKQLKRLSLFSQIKKQLKRLLGR